LNALGEEEKELTVMKAGYTLRTSWKTTGPHAPRFGPAGKIEEEKKKKRKLDRCI
jgi:hypothetical protein